MAHNNEDEEFDSEEEDDDIKAPAFVLQNLDIATTDCFDDDSCINASRIAAATIISQQICYYVSLVLNGFKNIKIPKAPNILIYGGGFIGKRVIEALVDNQCGKMLYVYSRGDLRAKYWRSTGLRSSPSLSRLMKGEKADIVIVLSGMSSFNTLSKVLIPHVTRVTCLITSALGLERKRFFALMRTPCIFRTFIEAPTLIEQIIDNDELAYQLKEGRLESKHGVIPPNQYEKNKKKEVDDGEDNNNNNNNNNISDTGNSNMGAGDTSGNGDGENENCGDNDGDPSYRPGSPGLNSNFDAMDDLYQNSMDSSLHGTILDSLFSFRLDPQPLLKGTIQGSVEHAADLVAKRLRRIKDMIYLVENYYAVLGITHKKSRILALYSVLGLTNGYSNIGGFSGVGLGSGGGSHFDNDNNSVKSNLTDMNFDGASTVNSYGDNDDGDGNDDGSQGDVIANILKNVQSTSYPILIDGLETLEWTIACHFRSQFSKYIHVIDIPNVDDIIEKRPLQGAESKKSKLARMKSKAAANAAAASGSGGDGLAMVNMLSVGNAKMGERADADGALRDDGANDEDLDEQIHALSHGVPMHSDEVLRKMFGYDMKLTGRAAMVAREGRMQQQQQEDELDIHGMWSHADDDDTATINTHMSGLSQNQNLSLYESQSMRPASPTMSITADIGKDDYENDDKNDDDDENEDENADKKPTIGVNVNVNVNDFPKVNDVPRMMANPIVAAAASVEADAEMKLLQFLEQEQIRKEEKEKSER